MAMKNQLYECFLRFFVVNSSFIQNQGPVSSWFFLFFLTTFLLLCDIIVVSAQLTWIDCENKD